VNQLVEVDEGRGIQYKQAEMTVEERVRDKREEILRLAARHGASNVRIFGSVARGEAGPGSDVDFLVDMGPEHSLFDRLALLVELREALGREVDVATEQVLRPELRERVLREAMPL